ncbi:hypothetical protein [Nocardia sp. NPDC005745]|uniref:hypothetical protein n=1 Tax=Nocardia sp. NPDC005745 TaxID=3157061 RepID=UPI00340F1CC7
MAARKTLLACYLLAAACAGGDLLHVAEWLGHDQDTTPALILRKMRKLRPAQRILEYQALHSRQRDGLFDMARRFLNVLSDEVYAQMVCPPIRRRITVHERGDNDIDIGLNVHSPRHDLPEFDPRFVGHIDPHLRVILDAANGPLHRCTPEHHTDSPGLSFTDVPLDWFAPVGSVAAVEDAGFVPDFRILNDFRIL